MTRSDAVLMMLQIISECNKHTEDGTSCHGCPFGKGPECMASGGGEIPTEWRIAEVIDTTLNEGKR